MDKHMMVKKNGKQDKGIFRQWSVLLAVYSSTRSPEEAYASVGTCSGYMPYFQFCESFMEQELSLLSHSPHLPFTGGMWGHYAILAGSMVTAQKATCHKNWVEWSSWAWKWRMFQCGTQGIFTMWVCVCPGVLPSWGVYYHEWKQFL